MKTTQQQQNQKPQRPKTINEINKSKKAETMSTYFLELVFKKQKICFKLVGHFSLRICLFHMSTVYQALKRQTQTNLKDKTADDNKIM